MTILWLVSITLPAAAAACGLAAREVGGGWLTGQLDALQALPDAPRLVIANVEPRVASRTIGGTGNTRFALLPDGTEETFAALLRSVHPDLVHIWGTEYPAAATLQQVAQAAEVPVLIGMQGVMRDCAAHLCDGVPPRYRGSNGFQRFVDRFVPGALLDKMQANFDALAESEASVLRQAHHVTGRTRFDRAAVSLLAPSARYYLCNETLRPNFYAPPQWRPHSIGSAPVLLLTQGNYPLKNLHTLLQALPAVCKVYPDLRVRIAGWPPLDKGPLLRPIIRQMFPYQTYCRKLAHKLGVADRIEYTGPLQEADMRQAYLDADLFVLPSFSENSPNSLGEAMLLGLPCVASRVGGIPDLLDDGREGVLYGPAGNPEALSAALLRVLGMPDHGAALGRAAAQRAQDTHDPVRNARTLYRIYEQILTEEVPA